jgi:hypothetical protein
MLVERKLHHAQHADEQRQNTPEHQLNHHHRTITRKTAALRILPLRVTPAHSTRECEQVDHNSSNLRSPPETTKEEREREERAAVQRERSVSH